MCIFLIEDYSLLPFSSKFCPRISYCCRGYLEVLVGWYLWLNPNQQSCTALSIKAMLLPSLCPVRTHLNPNIHNLHCIHP